MNRYIQGVVRDVSGVGIAGARMIVPLHIVNSNCNRTLKIYGLGEKYEAAI
jgi:hypothetical protein